nr:MAG TPA: hypothetical protein [Caudoviricetes sp.]
MTAGAFCLSELPCTIRAMDVCVRYSAETAC